jgi:hypothetical protein
MFARFDKVVVPPAALLSSDSGSSCDGAYGAACACSSVFLMSLGSLLIVSSLTAYRGRTHNFRQSTLVPQPQLSLKLLKRRHLLEKSKNGSTVEGLSVQERDYPIG